MKDHGSAVLTTPDGRYIVVSGRLWRAANPSLDPAEREALVSDLMRARRDVATAQRAGDEAALRDARRRVNAAKVALGERGPLWWDDAPSYQRHLVKNTPYAEWYERQLRWEAAIVAMLDQRDPSVTICPSEVARAEEPKRWREFMQEIRDAARRLAQRGLVELRQKGVRIDERMEPRGPIRIARL